MDKKPILARVVIEILGAPKAHVEESLKLLVERIREMKGVKIMDEKMFEPQKKEEKDTFFVAFTELEIWFDGWEPMLEVCFDYIPSSVEIIEPEEMRFLPSDLSGFVNDVLARLHGVDMALKEANAERIVVRENFTNLMRNLIMLSLRSGSKPLSELSAEVGIIESQLKPFLDRFLSDNILSLEGDLYSLVEHG